MAYSGCKTNCAGGHYTDFEATTSVCPSNSNYAGDLENTAIKNWPTTNPSGWTITKVASGNKIQDTDIISNLVTAVNTEIDRYNLAPRYDTSGNKISLMEGTIPTTEASGLDKKVINESIWRKVVTKANALSSIRGLTTTVDSTKFDKSINPGYGPDKITAEYINNIVDVLSAVGGSTGCGTVCRCNVVCNCNGNCDCVY
jgi:hypothetical protein